MPTSLVWIAALLGAVELWFWLTNGNDVQGLLGAAALLLTATLGTVRLSRARAARRFNSAMDAYAKREIGREWWRKRPPRVRGVSILGGALPSGSTHARGTTCPSTEPIHTGAAAIVPAWQHPVPRNGEKR
jgi:hypothetical protein